MSDFGTFVTEYFVTAPTEPGITERQRYAGPCIKAAGSARREIAERLTTEAHRRQCRSSASRDGEATTGGTRRDRLAWLRDLGARWRRHG